MRRFGRPDISRAVPALLLLLAAACAAVLVGLGFDPADADTDSDGLIDCEDYTIATQTPWMEGGRTMKTGRILDTNTRLHRRNE